MPKLLFIFLIGLMLAGCEDKPQFTQEEIDKMPPPVRDGLPEASGGFTLSVGDRTVTAEEVIGPIFEDLAKIALRSDFDQFSQIVRPAVEQQVVMRISDAILYSRAKKDAADKVDDELDRITTAEIRRFVMDFGGDYAKAEQALKRMNMSWGDFEQYKRRYILSQSYIAQQLPKEQPVSFSEMIALYNDTKEQLYKTPGLLRFGLIDIDISNLRDIDPNRSREVQAKELANEIYKGIKPQDDFDKLVKDYSRTNKAISGGVLKFNPDSLASPYDVLARHASAMKPAEFTEPIEAKGHIFIMQLIEYKPNDYEPFEKVQNQVRAEISAQRMREAINKINEQLIQQASVADRARFVNFCLREAYRTANK